MLKVLLKKQFAELKSLFTLGGSKEGKNRKKVTVIGIAVLLLYAVFASAWVFWEYAGMLCAPYHAAELDWVYFAVSGTSAATIGCVGSAFMAKNRLYEAKDNELLLSMPIPPSLILLTRVVSLYLFTAIFTSVSFLPACVRYFIVAGVSLQAVVSCVLIALVLPLGVTGLSCLLGWLIAMATARTNKKNLVTTIALIAFLVGYSIFSSRMQELLNYAAANGAVLGQQIQAKLYLFWKMGLGATGDILSTLIFCAMFLVIFALVYVLLDKTFLYVVTERRTGKRTKYRGGENKSNAPMSALMRKELSRYTKNPMIFFNCGLSSVLCLLFLVYFAVDPSIKKDILSAGLPNIDLAAIATTVMLFITSSTMITSSSISLEGENLWLLRSMPVTTQMIFFAKTAFHWLYASLPAALTMIVFFASLQVSFGYIALAVLAVLTSVALFASLGLAINLKFPNLTWTNEVVAVKQSVSPLVAMLGGWGVSALILLGALKLVPYLGVWYLVIVAVVMTAASAGIWLWLKKRGVEIFETL